MSASGGWAAPKKFPSLEEQLAKARVKPGTALDRLIRAHQDFGRLKDRDAGDRIVPPWLKVYWQKGHPEGNYDNPDDPTGGYPHLLKEILEWMVTHQTLETGKTAVGIGELEESEGLEALESLESIEDEGTNVSASGAQPSVRSESDVRVNYWSPQKILIGSNNIRGNGAQGMYSSSDGGATWTRTHLPILGGDSFHSDPTVDWTSDGTAWSTTIGVSGATRIRSYRSTDGGKSWVFDGTVSGSQTMADKQLQWIDHSASSPFANRNYVIWRNGSALYVNRRTAAGWETPVKVSRTETTGSPVGADVKTNARGEVFGFYPDTGSRGIYIVKSSDGGKSFAKPVKVATTFASYDIGVPAFNSRRALLYVSGGAFLRGTSSQLYALWTDLSGASGCTTNAQAPGASTASPCKTRIFFSRSTDGGATWSARVKLNDQAGLNDQFNAALAVDETNGNLAAIYYDTVDDPGRRKVDLFRQLSVDGGATWQSPVKVTTAMSDETAGGNDSNQFGDYNGLSGYANAFFPSWTDRRNGGNEEIWTAKIAAPTGATFSISGSAGAAGATLSAGAVSTTSNAAGSYALTGLAAGTFTVTPVKNGCTFSPASSVVTLTSSGAAGVSFAASCSAPTFSISGNAGTPGATVSAGARTALADAAGHYALSALTAGTYTVTPAKSGCQFSPASSTVTLAAAGGTASFTASCGSADTELTSGVALMGEGVLAGAWKYYSIAVPPNAASLTFTTTNATSDVDIYTQFAVKPASGSWICRPFSSSGNETCTAANPAAGTWWLGVHGFSAGGYTVTATVKP